MGIEWQIWECDDGVAFSTAAGIADQIRKDILSAGARHIASIMATSHNDAMCKYHDAMGWEPYRPMVREDGSFYPEDEVEME